jgi:hypothetical protein
MKVKASCGGPGFSHVFFADDLLLFAKANNKNCEAISNVLEEFCAMSVQKVSKAKSWVFFSPNVSSRNMQSICTKLGFSSTNSLGKYLGFPIMHKNRSHSEFNFLMEKVQERLAGWKTCLLSPASRLVLIKAAVTPIPKYIMQCAIIPAKVCNVVDKLCRDFLWGSTNEKRKLHMISWKTVTLPKHLGGLGICNLRDRNKAFLAKFCWRIAMEHDTPWARMITSKYLTLSKLTPKGKKLHCSRVWAACKLG